MSVLADFIHDIRMRIPNDIGLELVIYVYWKMLNIRIVFTIDDTGWIPRSGGREGAPSQFLAKCTENLALVPQ